MKLHGPKYLMIQIKKLLLQHGNDFSFKRPLITFFFIFTKPLTFLLKQLLSVIKFPTCIERFVKKGINYQNSTKKQRENDVKSKSQQNR